MEQTSNGVHKIYVTRSIPGGIQLLKDKGYEVDVSEKQGVLTSDELIAALSAKPYDAVLCLLTDPINKEVFDAAPNAKIFANYAVGFNNIDLEAAKAAGVTVSNTPDVLTDTVAEHTAALILSVAARVVEADAYLRAGKYKGWEPELLLGTDLKGKTIGILGAGRIGSRVLHHMTRGFDMQAIYYDIKRNEALEQEHGARFVETVEGVLKEADVVSVHVPLLPTTTHLINAERLAMMKKGAILVNTSRGPVIDEVALVAALKEGVIAGAGLDVFEHEPELTSGLKELSNVVITPHTASASVDTRRAMGEVAARNIISFFETGTAPNAIKS